MRSFLFRFPRISCHVSKLPSSSPPPLLLPIGSHTSASLPSTPGTKNACFFCAPIIVNNHTTETVSARSVSVSVTFQPRSTRTATSIGGPGVAWRATGADSDGGGGDGDGTPEDKKNAGALKCGRADRTLPCHIRTCRLRTQQREGTPKPTLKGMDLVLPPIRRRNMVKNVCKKPDFKTLSSAYVRWSRL